MGSARIRATTLSHNSQDQAEAEVELKLGSASDDPRDSQAETTHGEQQPPDGRRIQPDLRGGLAMSSSERTLVESFLDVVVGQPADCGADEACKEEPRIVQVSSHETRMG
jgi:hypothetical protein